MDEIGFVYLDDHLTKAKYDVRYAGTNNFVGRPVEGYHVKRLVGTHQMVSALGCVEQSLEALGWGLKVFDTYRPQRAVSDFAQWALIPHDTLTKSIFYPDQHKEELFDLGYIARRSGHSRGSTVDLTMYSLSDGSDIDMGGPYDFFGKISHLDYEDLSVEQIRNRTILRIQMETCGFRPYIKEWWHYTLRDEPYPDQYFDFIVRYKKP